MFAIGTTLLCAYLISFFFLVNFSSNHMPITAYYIRFIIVLLQLLLLVIINFLFMLVLYTLIMVCNFTEGNDNRSVVSELNILAPSGPTMLSNSSFCLY